MSLKSIIGAYRHTIDRAIHTYLKREIKNLPALGSPIVSLGYRSSRRACFAAGKRLRPILTMAAYRAVGGRNENAVLEPSLAFEFFHAYTLVHDDIYDEDDIRRNEPSVHAGLTAWFRNKHKKDARRRTLLYKNRAKRFGVVGGVLGGECLHNICIGAILNSKISLEKKIEGMKIYKEAAQADNACQLLDLALETEHLTARKYRLLARYKSGKLMRAAVEWGAVLGGGSPSQRRALGAYAEHLGQAFQIKDDILDIGLRGEKGRPAGSDLREGKKTLLLLRALRVGSASDRRDIARVFGKIDAPAGQIRRAIGVFERTGSVAYCERVARRTITAGIAALETAQPAFRKDAKDFLVKLAKFTIDRTS